MKMAVHEILTGDSREILPKLAAESVQCCVTSPPYWGLRDYNHPAQIGAEPSPVQYVENLVEKFREVRRVMRKDGASRLNVGGSLARNGGNCTYRDSPIVPDTKASSLNPDSQSQKNLLNNGLSK
jgi:DNA modification methylase